MLWDWFYRKQQQKLNRQIAIAKLTFLADDFKNGKDKASDYRFWKEQLELLKECDDGRSKEVADQRFYFEYIFLAYCDRHELPQEA